MTHLTRDELLAWRDRPGPADRARVIEHLAACDACGAVYAELFRTRPADQPQPAAFDTARFALRGYAAGRQAPSRPRLARLLVPLAAAALIVAALLIPQRQRDLDPVADTDAVRGSRIETVQAAAGGAIVFAWTSPFAADRYAVEVTDASATRIFYRETRESRLTPGPELSGSLRPGGRYTWTVTALDSAGEAISRSAPRELRADGGSGR
jgi:hypothetical protein